MSKVIQKEKSGGSRMENKAVTPSHHYVNVSSQVELLVEKFGIISRQQVPQSVKVERLCSMMKRELQLLYN